MSKYTSFEVGDACGNPFKVGERIIAPGGREGEISSVHKKIGITWKNGLSAEYTPKQMQAWNYQKFLEDETQEAIAQCRNSDSLISAQESVQDSALQDCNLDLTLSEPQRLTNTAQISLNCDIQKLTTTETCKNSPIPEHSDCDHEQLILSQQVPPAPHFPQKGSDLEAQMSEIVSPPSLEPLENCNPSSQPLKTSQDSLPAPITQDNPQAHISEEWSEPLTSSGTMRNGLLSAVDTLPVPSLESEYCWLRSPGALSLSGKGRPPGQTKQEAELKKLGLINKGEVLNPVILCQWYEIPDSWLDPSESRAATELLESNERQQEIFSILESPQLPLTESYTSTPYAENQQLQKLKAITLHEPWAYLVGRYKWFETRSWPTNYRGKIAIHAAKRQKDTDYWCNLLKDLLPPVEELVFGAVVAIANLTDCILMTEEFISQQSETELRCGLWEPGRYAWKLENVEIIPEPIPARGKQGLWEIELSVVAPQHLIDKFFSQRETLKAIEENQPIERTQESLILCPSCELQHIYLSCGCGMCSLAPENFLEETQPQPVAVQKPKGRQRKGCLYKYLENKKLKDGTIASYPRVIGHRQPDNPAHWRWGFNWEIKDQYGEWKGRSIGSVPTGAIALVISMQNEGAPLKEIIGFIRRAKSKKS